MRHHSTIKALITAGILCLHLFIGHSLADKNNIHQVKDLAYGVSLFHFFQEKYFSAITDLLISDHYHRTQSGDKNPQLLLGGLYLSYDLHQQSAEIFKTLLDDEYLDTSITIKDRAWYLLGKNYFQNELYLEAEDAFKKVTNSLQEDDEAERLYLISRIFLSEKNLSQARKILDLFPPNSIWKSYSQFNVASQLIQDKEKSKQGKALFDDITQSSAITNEEKNIQDKANLALAYVALKDKQSQVSIERFNKVRLNSTETNKALIGLGWANYRQEHYNDAIVPWMNLASSQTETDLAVQEALISIPYAFEKMDDKEQALHQYESAINSYKYHLNETDKLKKFILSYAFIQQLNPGSLGNEAIPVSNIIKNFNPLLSRYLLSFLSSNKFQHAVKSYQEIIHLNFMLGHWQNNIPALNMILREKRKTYKNKLTQVMNDESLSNTSRISKKRNRLARQLKQIEKKQDSIKLANQDELEKLNLLKINQEKIKHLATTEEDISEQVNKQRLLQGLITWRLNTEFPQRLWIAKRHLQDLNNAVVKMNTSITSLKSAWKQAPKDFSTFDGRINNKQAQIHLLQKKLNKAIKAQQKLLREMTLETLKKHRNQLKLYHDRALYAKARLYDSLMARE